MATASAAPAASRRRSKRAASPDDAFRAGPRGLARRLVPRIACGRSGPRMGCGETGRQRSGFLMDQLNTRICPRADLLFSATAGAR